MVEYTQLEKEWERPAKFESGKRMRLPPRPKAIAEPDAQAFRS